MSEQQQRGLIVVGYFVRRTVVDVPAVSGKAFCAYSHQLFPTRHSAQAYLDMQRVRGTIDRRYTYDVAEAWMNTGDGDGA